jgi:hypothetical protein
MDLELCRSPDQSTLVAVESVNEEGVFEALPFMHIPDDSERARFAKPEMANRPGVLRFFEHDHVQRRFNLATDEWRAGDLSYTLYSPIARIPDLEREHDDMAAAQALLPAVRAELTIDNRHGQRPRRVVLGLTRQDATRGLSHLNHENLIGVVDGRHLALATDTPGAWAAVGFDPLSMLSDPHVTNRRSLLGNWACLFSEVPAGEMRVFRFAYCFFRGDEATSGLPTRYYYTRWFDSLGSVAAFAFRHFDAAIAAAGHDDAQLDASGLSDSQRFTIAHATRSYIYSTQLLDHAGRPIWVVNEGEYNMLNTLDLAADHSLYEAHQNPWTIRNVLDQYIERYSYDDDLRFPGSNELHPGGLTFTHDMGIAGVFSPPGRSSYEMAGLTGCFSYMSSEELLNWILCAGLYVEHGSDLEWARQHADVLERCQASLEARDHYDPTRRCGIPRGNSSRCEGGREITTYDCLDPSLGQASGNIYIGTKAWAAELILTHLFKELNRPAMAARAQRQADLAAATVIASVKSDGRIPALLNDDSGAVVLPVIESLVYPWFAGCREALSLDGRYAPFLSVLTRHMREHVLTRDGCLLEDGGWLISSHSRNTFPAKVYVSQFVLNHILKFRLYDVEKRADLAHALWQLHPEHSRHCWTEQIDSGVAHAAKYYPRGVSSNIWRYGCTTTEDCSR